MKRWAQRAAVYRDRSRREALRAISVAVIAVPAIAGPAAFRPAAAAAPMRLVTASAPPLGPDSDSLGFSGEVTREAFRRLGFSVEIAVLPAERALANVNDGVDDGELLRVEGIDAKYPNLVRVPEPVMSVDFVAFARDPGISIDGWRSLAGYALGYVQGWIIYEVNSPDPTPVIARDMSQLLRVLEAGHVDLALAERWQGLYLLRELGIEARLLEPPLATHPMYIYLNRRHEQLVAPLARALVAMKSDGTYTRHVAERLEPLSRFGSSR